MSESAPHAIFLSYASQDAEAARRICDSLRAAGLEVWFDQNELVGGDAWNQKIRGQIKACALFVPIISAETQSRREGYFRREWKQAAERTRDIAEGTPFLLPVVVDATRDGEALVPEEFRSVQWTRLARGEVTAQFIEHVKRLLAPAGEVAAGRGLPTPPLGRLGAGAGGQETPTLQQTKRPLSWIWAAFTIVALGLIAFFATRKSAPPAAATKPVAETKSSAPVIADKSAPADKSIAVLPFANMSEDKEANAFFADGIQEDILTNLANLADLRVVSRTSVMEYRNTTKKIRQIARELGVAFVLEGSVRRAGNKVKVTGQLIDARTDAHLWAKNYDRDLTDIFAIQSELAKEIAGSLQAVLTPQEKSRLERAPTDNLHAYELFSQARALRESIKVLDFTAMRRDYDKVVSLLEQAVQLDPKFVAAWTQLAEVDGNMYFNNADHAPARLARAREAIDAAARAAPDDPEVVLAQGQFYFFGFRDWARARTQYERVIAQSPGNLRAHYLLAEVSRYEGRWGDAVAGLRKVLAGDPRDWYALGGLARTLALVHRYDQAAAIWRTMAEIRPDDSDVAYNRAELAFHATGSRQELDEFFFRLPKNQPSDDRTLRLRFLAAWVCGEAAGLIHWTEALGGATLLDDQRKVQLCAALLATGDSEGARALLGPTRASQEKTVANQPENWGLWIRLAESCAYLGDASAADASLTKAAALRPLERDAVEGARTAMERAIVCAWTGRKDEAVREVAKLLRAPCPGVFGYAMSIPHLRSGLEWAPLRDRPDFQALLNDPKNNAPLF